MTPTAGEDLRVNEIGEDRVVMVTRQDELSDVSNLSYKLLLNVRSLLWEALAAILKSKKKFHQLNYLQQSRAESLYS